MSTFEIHYCLYCGDTETTKVKISNPTFVHRNGKATLQKAAQYVDACPVHAEQIRKSLGEKIKRPVRPRIMTGQTTIEDFLR